MRGAAFLSLPWSMLRDENDLPVRRKMIYDEDPGGEGALDNVAWLEVCMYKVWIYIKVKIHDV